MTLLSGHNTGYKSADPSRPCRKCWNNYAKQYRGALTYAPSGGRSLKQYTFQRPLPSFLPPQTSAAIPSQSESKDAIPSHPLVRVFLASAFGAVPRVTPAEIQRTGRRRRGCCRRAGRGVVL
jgi:hypothetical protein